MNVPVTRIVQKQLPEILCIITQFISAFNYNRTPSVTLINSRVTHEISLRTTQHRLRKDKEFATATSEKKNAHYPTSAFFDMLFSDIIHAKSCKNWLVRRNPHKVRFYNVVGLLICQTISATPTSQRIYISMVRVTSVSRGGVRSTQIRSMWLRCMNFSMCEMTTRSKTTRYSLSMMAAVNSLCAALSSPSILKNC